PVTICWIDAAPSTGLVAVVNESRREYQVFKLESGWKRGGRDCNWAEAIGFELLIQWLTARRCTGEVVVNCDSTAALNVFAGKKMSSQHLNEVGSRLEEGRKEWPFTVKAQWVKGQLNLADRFSRGKSEQGYKETRCEVEIPRSLRGFVSCKKIL
ncbi:hypothetical protein FRC11_003582, partial [Ceratobasidium sp. 423]